METLYAIFDNDGYECCSFRGVWNDRDDAEKEASGLRIADAEFFKELGFGKDHSNSRSFTVVPIKTNRLY